MTFIKTLLLIFQKVITSVCIFLVLTYLLDFFIMILMFFSACLHSTAGLLLDLMIVVFHR